MVTVKNPRCALWGKKQKDATSNRNTTALTTYKMSVLFLCPCTETPVHQGWKREKEIQRATVSENIDQSSLPHHRASHLELGPSGDFRGYVTALN